MTLAELYVCETYRVSIPNSSGARVLVIPTSCVFPSVVIPAEGRHGGGTHYKVNGVTGKPMAGRRSKPNGARV